MGMNREQYGNIEIPAEVSGILEKAVLRKRKANARIFAAIAMVSAVFLTASNTPSVYAALAQIPVIGDAVRIFHIGSGGQRSDGLKADMEAEEEKLRLVFSQNPPAGGQAADAPAGDTGAGEQAADAPAYHIEQFAAPERIAITVHGIRSCQPEKLIEEAEKCSYIKTAYREMLLDDSAVRIVLELQPGTGFEVTEYREPASLELRLYASPKQDREVWFIRSRKMEMSEELALMPELLAQSNGVIAGTKDGRYIFCIGEFESEEQARQALAAMDEHAVSEYSFTADHCKSSERPD